MQFSYLPSERSHFQIDYIFHYWKWYSNNFLISFCIKIPAEWAMNHYPILHQWISRDWSSDDMYVSPLINMALTPKEPELSSYNNGYNLFKGTANWFALTSTLSPIDQWYDRAQLRSTYFNWHEFHPFIHVSIAQMAVLINHNSLHHITKKTNQLWRG